MSDDRLRAVVAECLQMPVSRVQGSMSRQETAEWDSLNHLRLITAIESEFGIAFTMDEIASIATLADLRRAIAEHGSP